MTDLYDMLRLQLRLLREEERIHIPGDFVSEYMLAMMQEDVAEAALKLVLAEEGEQVLLLLVLFLMLPFATAAAMRFLTTVRFSDYLDISA
jgi:hypothetical protein